MIDLKQSLAKLPPQSVPSSTLLLGGKAVDVVFCAYPALQEHWTSDGAGSVQVASAWQGLRSEFPQIFGTTKID